MNKKDVESQDKSNLISKKWRVRYSSEYHFSEPYDLATLPTLRARSDLILTLTGPFNPSTMSGPMLQPWPSAGRFHLQYKKTRGIF